MLSSHLLAGALGNLENVRVDAKGSDGSTGTSALDDQGVGETLGGEGNDIVASLQRGKRMAGGVSVVATAGQMDGEEEI